MDHFIMDKLSDKIKQSENQHYSSDAMQIWFPELKHLDPKPTTENNPFLEIFYQQLIYS